MRTKSMTARLLYFALVCLAIALSSWRSAAMTGDATLAFDSKVEELAWMSGDWETGQGDMRGEEHWTRVAGGTMIGMGRTVAHGKTVFFEYLRIETRPDGIYYVAHPKARPGTDFKLVRLEGQVATFENLAHDFPKRIIYRKNADGSLTARIEGDGTEKEKPQDFQFRPMK